jgi:hypothetical protein
LVQSASGNHIKKSLYVINTPNGDIFDTGTIGGWQHANAGLESAHSQQFSLFWRLAMRGHFMKKFIALAFATTAALALTACGSSESAKEEAQADNVEMPAEEAVGDVDATPVADASAGAGAEAATGGDAAKQ